MNIFLLLLLLTNLLVSYIGFTNHTFFVKNQFDIASIRQGQSFRMLASGFLHADWSHLIFNMFTLYMFAPQVINYLGSFYFFVLYIISLLAGSLFTLYLHKNDYNYKAVGASGAVMGVVYSAILINPEMSLYLYFIPIPIPAYIFGVGYLLYSIYGIKAQNDNIGHTAHFGGAIGGYVITLIKSPELFIQNKLMVVLLMLPIIVLCFFIISWKKQL